MTAPRPPALADSRTFALVRAIPVAELRLLLDELDGLLGQPSCPEAQADGGPCPSAATACDQCARARTVVASVRRRLGLG